MGQELSVDFSYNQLKKSLIVDLVNNTDKQMAIRNHVIEENPGSQILLVGKSVKGVAKTVRIALSDSQKIIPLSPRQKAQLSWPINSFFDGTVEKAVLKLSFVGWNKMSGKYKTQEIEKEIAIGD